MDAGGKPITRKRTLKSPRLTKTHVMRAEESQRRRSRLNRSTNVAGVSTALRTLEQATVANPYLMRDRGVYEKFVARNTSNPMAPR